MIPASLWPENDLQDLRTFASTDKITEEFEDGAQPKSSWLHPGNAKYTR